MMPLDALSSPASQVGDNCLAEECNETQRDPADAGPEHPVGAGDERVQEVGDFDAGESALRLDDILKRFDANTPRLSERTRAEYRRSFAQFWRAEKLWEYSRRDLAGKKGKEALKRHLNTRIPPHSRVVRTAGIKRVLKRGLDLPWPLDVDDLEPSPRRRIVPGPRRPDVEPWAKAIRSETDPYLRSWFLAEVNYGLRPFDQQAALRRKHVVFSEATGKALGFVAHGADSGFKRDQYVIAAFPEEVSEAMDEWLKTHPSADQEAPIWPYRDANGTVYPNRPHTAKTYPAMRRRFARKWGITFLTAKAVRKFVKGVLIDAGMPQPYRASWEGHAPDFSDMDAVYGTKPWEETLASQLRYLPGGTLAVFGTENALGGGEFPTELVHIWEDFRSGRIDRLEVANRMQAIRPPVIRELVRP